MGKAYANRRRAEDRPANDFYQTPKCLTWELIATGVLDNCQTILEPCDGKGAISNVLKEHGYSVTCRDFLTGNDFLKDDYSNEHYGAVVTNPPFSLWDKFVIKAQSVADLVCVIGRTNYFGAHQRNVSGLWDHLREVHVFDRQIDYSSEFRDDGMVKCGCLVTGWFIFDNTYWGETSLHIIDVQKYILKKS